jgi:hypothetical protein
MAGNPRRTRKNDTQATRRNRSPGQGRAGSRQAPIASASTLTGNAVPVPRKETRPEQRPIPSEENQSARQPTPAQEPPSRAKPDVQLRSTDVDGREKSWSVTGLDQVSNALCRVILCCGFASIPIACVLVHSSIQDKVICALLGPVVGALIWIVSQARQRLKQQQEQGNEQTPTDDVDPGQPRLPRTQWPSAVTTGSASQAAAAASAAVTPIQTTARSEPENPDEAHAPAAVAVIPASTQ